MDEGRLSSVRTCTPSTGTLSSLISAALAGSIFLPAGAAFLTQAFESTVHTLALPTASSVLLAKEVQLHVFLLAIRFILRSFCKTQVLDILRSCFSFYSCKLGLGG